MVQQHFIKIKSVHHLNHDVLRFETEKPEDFYFAPGQATLVAINKDGWEKKKRPFTFTNLPDEDHLEFTIKTYPQHEGVTNQLLSLKPGDELIIGDAWGTINYKGEGVFIAGGAGVTPFISILRYLHLNNEIENSKLICANKTAADIINREEFKEMLGPNFINILSAEVSDEFTHGLINEDFLRNNGVNDHEYVYLCGPKSMMDSIEEQLRNLNVNEDSIVKEVF
ncbi:MAG: FAD-binding oxidoreductase [Candidatus Saccharimonadaceae bacterium]